MSITQNGVLKKDDNGYPVMGGTSSADNKTILNSAIEPSSRRLLTDAVGGTIVGPDSSTDTAIVRWIGTNGTTIQDSSVLIDDLGNLNMGSGDINTGSGNLNIGSGNLNVGSSAIEFTTNDPTTKIYVDTGATPQDNVSIDVASYKSLFVENNGIGVGSNGEGYASVFYINDSAQTGLTFVSGEVGLVAAGATRLITSSGNIVISANCDAASYSVAGTPPVADGTYTVGIGVTTNGTITIQGGIITAVQEAS